LHDSFLLEVTSGKLPMTYIIAKANYFKVSSINQNPGQNSAACREVLWIKELTEYLYQ